MLCIVYLDKVFNLYLLFQFFQLNDGKGLYQELICNGLYQVELFYQNIGGLCDFYLYSVRDYGCYCWFFIYIYGLERKNLRSLRIEFSLEIEIYKYFNKVEY